MPGRAATAGLIVVIENAMLNVSDADFADDFVMKALATTLLAPGQRFVYCPDLRKLMSEARKLPGRASWWQQNFCIPVRGDLSGGGAFDMVYNQYGVNQHQAGPSQSYQGQQYQGQQYQGQPKGPELPAQDVCVRSP